MARVHHLELVCALAALVLGTVVLVALRARRGRRAWGIAGALVALAFAGVAVAASPAVSDAASAGWGPTTVHRGPGYAGIRRLRIPVLTASRSGAAFHAGPTPKHGIVGSVVIPAIRSHFRARPAIVYLPPAALVEHPRALPVVVAFSGQSRGAGPQDLVRAGHLGQLMDSIAAQHHGVSPIVVVPDQLGPASANPMCVDSAHFGRVATYIMGDVRGWILTHLPVATGRTRWTVAGFSEGGTCSIQFASQYPEVFGSLVDVSGERAPTNGTLAHTVAVGFAGSVRAYRRATPAWQLAHHRYRDEDAYFAAGALDRLYGPNVPWMAALAHRAGMTTSSMRVPGVAHDWRTADGGFRWAFDRLARRWAI